MHKLSMCFICILIIIIHVYASKYKRLFRDPHDVRTQNSFNWARNTKHTNTRHAWFRRISNDCSKFFFCTKIATMFPRKNDQNESQITTLGTWYKAIRLSFMPHQFFSGSIQSWIIQKYLNQFCQCPKIACQYNGEFFRHPHGFVSQKNGTNRRQCLCVCFYVDIQTYTNRLLL